MEQGFIDALRENPDDLVNHLVYADWLDENGHTPRAEYIRAWCAAKSLPPGREQLRRLETLHPRPNEPHSVWCEVDPKIARVYFAGAVIERLELIDSAKHAQVAPLLDRFAVKELHTHFAPPIRALSEYPSLQQVQALNLGNASSLESWLISSDAPPLRRLTLRGSFDTHLARLLARSRSLRSLRSLTSNNGGLDDGGVVQLLRSKHLDNLEEWHIQERRVTAMSFVHLFRNGRATRWKSLDYRPLHGTILDVIVLNKCENLERLTLRVPLSGDSVDAVTNLLAHLPRLRELNLSGYLNADLVRRLGHSWPGLRQLERLSLNSTYRLSSVDLVSLATSSNRDPNTCIHLQNIVQPASVPTVDILFAGALV